MPSKGPHPAFGHLLQQEGWRRDWIEVLPKIQLFPGDLSIVPSPRPLRGEGAQRADEVPLVANAIAPVKREGDEQVNLRISKPGFLSNIGETVFFFSRQSYGCLGARHADSLQIAKCTF